MNAKPKLSCRPVIATVVAAALSVVISVGLLEAITASFRHDGLPFERWAAAERACADHRYVSKRDGCVRTYLAAARVRQVASR